MTQFKDMNDSQLCKSIKDGKQQAFAVFQERYQDVISKAVYKNITKGGFHKQLSVSYQSAMEDLCSQSWFEIYNQLTKNFQFKTTGQLKFYLYRIARSETCKFMRNRISLRKQAGTDANIQFPRFDAEYEKNINGFISVEYSDEVDHLIEKVLPELISKLSERELKVLEMQSSGILQKDIAIELGVDVRTIFNIREKITDKAKRMSQ